MRHTRLREPSNPRTSNARGRGRRPRRSPVPSTADSMSGSANSQRRTSFGRSPSLPPSGEKEGRGSRRLPAQHTPSLRVTEGVCVELGARGLGPQGALERLRPQKRSSSHCSQQEPPSCFGGAARVRDPLSSPAWREGLLRPAALTREARFRGAPWACSHAKHGPGPSGCVRLPE